MDGASAISGLQGGEGGGPYNSVQMAGRDWDR
jgi:hypothetical protein